MERGNRACQSYQLSGRSGSDTGAFQPDFRPLFFVPRSVALLCVPYVFCVASRRADGDTAGATAGFLDGPWNPLMVSRSFRKLNLSGNFCKTSGQPWWRLWVTLRLPAVISARACSHKTCCRFPYYVFLNGQNCHSERSEESKMVRVRNVSYSKDFRPFAPLRVTLHWE